MTLKTYNYTSTVILVGENYFLYLFKNSFYNASMQECEYIYTK